MDKVMQEQHIDIDAKNILESGFYVEQENFAEGVDEIVKCLLADAVLSMVCGIHSIPQNELDEMDKVMKEEVSSVRPVVPYGVKTNRIMAAFANGYALRFADLCDTQRQEVGRGGHTADMIAGILSFADDPEVTGKRILEAINFGYHYWADLQHKMMQKVPFLDGVTGLAVTMPFLIGLAKGDDAEKIKNALLVTANGGLFAVESRASKTVTNMKCAATGFALARAAWYYRMSEFVQNAPSMFTGVKGWSKLVAPLDSELECPSDDDVYSHIQLKTHPCCNVNQAAVDCAKALYKQVNGRLEDIDHIVIHVSKKDSGIAIKPGQPQYPTDHPSADHHIRFCTAITLLYGNIYPVHYEEKYLNDETVHALIDKMETVIIPDDEFTSMGAEAGCGIVEITMKDGTILREVLLKPEGINTGASCPEIAGKMRTMVKEKQEMIENSYGYDFSKTMEVLFNAEKYNGSEILDSIWEALGNKKR